MNFKVPTKISHVYEHSPYYKGSKLWDVLPETIQKSDNIYTFKAAVDNLHKAYKKIIESNCDCISYIDCTLYRQMFVKCFVTIYTNFIRKTGGLLR